MPTITCRMIRGFAGVRFWMTACVSDSKALIGVDEPSARLRGSDGNEGRGMFSLAFDVPVLQLPEVLVDVAAVEQFFVPADIVDLAAFHDQDRVRRHQHREPVRDADDRSGRARCA